MTERRPGEGHLAGSPESCIRPAHAFEHIGHAHREGSRLRCPNRPEHQRVVVVPVTVPAERDQIVGLFKSDARVRPMMNLEAVVTSAEFAGLAGPIQRLRPLALPVRRAEVLGIRQASQGHDRLFERLIDLHAVHGSPSAKLPATSSASVVCVRCRSCSST